MTKEDQKSIQQGLLVSLPVCRRSRINSDSQRIREDFPIFKNPEYLKPLLLFYSHYFSEDEYDRMLTWIPTEDGQEHVREVFKIFLFCQQPEILALTSAAILSLRPLDPPGSSMDDWLEPIGMNPTKPYIDCYDHGGI